MITYPHEEKLARDLARMRQEYAEQNEAVEAMEAEAAPANNERLERARIISSQYFQG